MDNSNKILDDIDFLIKIIFIVFLVLFIISFKSSEIIHYSGEYTATVTGFEDRKNLYGRSWYYVYFIIPEFGDFEFKIDDEKLYMNATYNDRFEIELNALSILIQEDKAPAVISYNFNSKNIKFSDVKKTSELGMQKDIEA